MIDRRLFVAGTAASLFPYRASARGDGDIFEQALIATFPLYETARLAMASPSGFNRLGHRRTLSDHTARAVTMPNNDTLYSACWLDVTTGPIDLTIPTVGGRYLSVALMDAFTDNVAVIRAPDRGDDRKVRIFGPGDAGAAPNGMMTVRMPSSYGWLIGRTFVEGGDDLAAARAVQDRILLHASQSKPSSLQLLSGVTTRPDGTTYLAAVKAALTAVGPKHPLLRNLRRYAGIGIGGREGWNQLDAKMQSGWTDALAKLAGGSMLDMRQHGTAHNGWTWPHGAIGAFGNNHHFRAAVALSGIGALPQSEAIYLRAVADNLGRPLQPQHRYTLKLPPTAELCEGFWSLSAYSGEADGRYFFEDNEIHRYAINSAMAGLMKEADGSVSISVQSTAPDDAGANWLPLPTTSPALMLRIYVPSKRLRRTPGLIEQIVSNSI